MLILMRRVGETIRINETATIEVIQINKDSVKLKVEDSLSSNKGTNHPPKLKTKLKLKMET